jgi:ADP-ribose pyrophosphatase YjhB (NUDIX family)
MQPQIYSGSEFPPRITLCVGAVVLKKDKVLFVRQAYGKEKGNWSIPWGFVDGNKPDGSLEPPDIAAIRETREEAGILIQVEGLLGMQSQRDIQGKLQVNLLYLCHHISGDPTPDNHETDKAAYLSLEEMNALDEPILEFCEWIARRALCGEHHLIPPVQMNPCHPRLAFL